LLADLHNDAGPESDELPAPVPRVKTVRTSLQPSDDAPTSVRLETAKHGKTAAKTQATIVSESTSDDDVMLSPRCAKTGNTPATNHKNQPPSESVRPDATAEDEAHVVVKEKLPLDFEEAVKKLMVQAFRVNYLFGQTELKAIISTALLNADATVKASFDEDNLRRLATRRIRGYVKNWVNTMPQKKFVKELVEKKLPATIASVKQVTSRVNIDKMLSKHHAFRSRASDETFGKSKRTRNNGGWSTTNTHGWKRSKGRRQTKRVISPGSSSGEGTACLSVKGLKKSRNRLETASWPLRATTRNTLHGKRSESWTVQAQITVHPARNCKIRTMIAPGVDLILSCKSKQSVRVSPLRSQY